MIVVSASAVAMWLRAKTCVMIVAASASAKAPGVSWKPLGTDGRSLSAMMRFQPGWSASTMARPAVRNTPCNRPSSDSFGTFTGVISVMRFFSSASSYITLIPSR